MKAGWATSCMLRLTWFNANDTPVKREPAPWEDCASRPKPSPRTASSPGALKPSWSAPEEADNKDRPTFALTDDEKAGVCKGLPPPIRKSSQDWEKQQT